MPAAHRLRDGLAWLVAGGCAAAFLALSIAVVVRPTPLAVDRHLLDAAVRARSPALISAAKAVTDLGSAPVTYGLMLVAGLLTWWRRRQRLAALAWAAAVVGLAMGQLARFAVNVLIARPRPPASVHAVAVSGYAFPSGHSTSATLTYGLLAWLATRSRPASPRPYLAAVWLLAVLLAAAVGVSRVLLGVHWSSDVLGGWLFGTGWLALLATQRWRLGRQPARSVSAAPASSATRPPPTAEPPDRRQPRRS